MRYNNCEFQTFAAYINDIYGHSSKQFGEVIDAVCRLKYRELESRNPGGKVDLQLWIAQTLRFFRISVSYTEGTKKKQCFEMFKERLLKYPVLSITDTMDADMLFDRKRADKEGGRTLLWIERAGKRYQVLRGDEKRIITALEMRRWYFSRESRIVSNTYFIGNGVTWEQMTADLPKTFSYFRKRYKDRECLSELMNRVEEIIDRWLIYENS